MFGNWRAHGLFALTLTLSALSQASVPASFIYQGQLSDLATGNGVSGTASFTFQIRSANAGCLLYEETQTIDLTSTTGYFTAAIGSLVGDGKRTANDRGLAMTQVFNNAATNVVAADSNCPGGYTPSSGDRRLLRVLVTQSGQTETLTPDQVIAAVPFATTANTLQGLQPGDFLRVVNTGGISLTQSNAETLFENTRFAKLVAFLNGSGSTDFGSQRLTSVATPTAGTDAANKQYCDTKLAGLNIQATAPANGQVLVYNSSNSQWEPVTLSAHARVAAATCAAGEASRWDGSAWSCITAAAAGGNYGGAQLHGSALNNTDLVIPNYTTKVNIFDVATAGRVQLPSATGASLGGPVFTFVNNGNISIPLVDSTGGFVAHLPPRKATNVYLTDNLSAAGDWATDSLESLVSTEREYLVSLPNFSSRYHQLDWFNTNRVVVTYNRANGGNPSNQDWLIRVGTADFVNKTLTWGPETTVKTDIGNAQIRVLGFNSGNLLILGQWDGSPSIWSATVDGANNISGVGETLVGGGAIGCEGVAKVSDGAICAGGGLVRKIGTDRSISSNSFSTGVSSNHNVQAYQSGGWDYFAYCGYNGSTFQNEHKVVAANFSTNSFTEINRPIMFGSCPNYRSFIPHSTSGFWYLVSNMSSSISTVHLTWNGSAWSTGAAPPLPYSMSFEVFQIGSDYYYSSSPNGTPKRYLIDRSSFGLTPSGKGPDSTYGHRYELGRSVEIFTGLDSLRTRFNAGY